MFRTSTHVQITHSSRSLSCLSISACCIRCFSSSCDNRCRGTSSSAYFACSDLCDAGCCFFIRPPRLYSSPVPAPAQSELDTAQGRGAHGLLNRDRNIRNDAPPTSCPAGWMRPRGGLLTADCWRRTACSDADHVAHAAIPATPDLRAGARRAAACELRGRPPVCVIQPRGARPHPCWRRMVAAAACASRVTRG